MIITCSQCGWQQAEHSPADFRCLRCSPKVYAPPGGAPRPPSRANWNWIVIALSGALGWLVGWLMGHGVSEWL